MRLTYSKMGVHYEKSWNPQGCVDAERHPASAFCVATIRFLPAMGASRPVELRVRYCAFV